MYRFEDLEQLYASIMAVEEAMKKFSSYAVYELDGGITVWCETKALILQNLADQKNLLRKLAADGNLTDKQKNQVKNWKLD